MPWWAWVLVGFLALTGESASMALLRGHPGCGEQEVNPATTVAVVRGFLGLRCGAQGTRTREVLRWSLDYPG
jgi:hypothetical protein